jgi:hypothetical protein
MPKPIYNEQTIDQEFMAFMKAKDDELDEVSDSMYLTMLQEGVRQFNQIHGTTLDHYESTMHWIKETSQKVN